MIQFTKEAWEHYLYWQKNDKTRYHVHPNSLSLYDFYGNARIAAISDFNTKS